MSENDKYKIAREFRDGCASCMSGKAVDLVYDSNPFIDGWNYAYKTLKPKMNNAVNKYIVKLGYKPFEKVVAMEE